MFGPALRYTLARLLLVLVSAGALYVVGLRGWPLAIGAIAISLPLSWFVLRSQREAFASRLDEKMKRRAQERDRLRAALRGDDAPATTSSDSGDSSHLDTRHDSDSSDSGTSSGTSSGSESGSDGGGGGAD